MPGAIRERWFADDWEFTEGDVRDVEYRSGQLRTPEKRGNNAVVANRPGEVWRPKKHGAGSFTLQVWLGTYQREAQLLWDELLRAVDQPHRLITWRRVTADGDNRFCQGEVTGALEPTAVGQAAYRAEIEVTVPAGYWYGDQLVTVSSDAGVTGTDTDGRPMREFELPGLATSTAPLNALTLRLDGQLPNPRLLDVTNRGRGDWLSYAGTIPAGGALTLGNAAWTTLPTGAGWTYNPAALNYSGDRFLELAATPPGVVHRLRLTADALPAGAKVTVAGYRSYLC